jgi:putative transcriptional regulator
MSIYIRNILRVIIGTARVIIEVSRLGVVTLYTRPSYTPLKVTLAKRNLTVASLREGTGIAPNTFTKINKNGWIALKVIAQICEYLDCRIEDVVEFVPDLSSHIRNENGYVKVTVTPK